MEESTSSQQLREEFINKFGHQYLSGNYVHATMEGSNEIFDWFLSRTIPRQELLETLEGMEHKIYNNWASTHDRDEPQWTKLTVKEKAYNQALSDLKQHFNL